MKTIHQGHLPVRTIVLIGMVFFITAQVHAQNANARLTLTLRNVTLKEFTKIIENSTGYSFIYSEEINIKHRINLKVKEKPLHEILDIVFKDETISYQFSDRYILLQKKKKTKNVSRKFTISGYVTDGTSSETLIGTNIFESHQNQGTTTNPYGFYSITLPEGETSLHFSYLGYATEVCQFILSQDTLMNIRMQGNTQLQEVVVVSDRAEAGAMATQMGSIEIPITQIKSTPSILGEADVMKAIQLIPGVQAGVDGSAGLYIRGGSPDQNLILLDGVPVYNVDHMFGFFSVFTPEAVKKVMLFKSSFPARFGGRLSSVIDVRTNDGDMQKYHGMLSIGLLTSKFNLEGPIVKGRTSFNISARRSYLDLLAKPFMPDDEKYSYYFYDINAKINHKFSDRSRLFLSIYNGKDHFATKFDENTDNEDGSKMNWGNTIASARWNYIFNNRLFSNTTVAFNNYELGIHSYMTNQFFGSTENKVNRYSADYRSGIQDWSYKIDFDFNPSPIHRIKFGTEYIYHIFRPEVMTSKISDHTSKQVGQEKTYYSINNNPLYAHEISAYAEDNFRLNTRFRLNMGAHLSLFHVQNKSYFSFQPRISARYQLVKDIALKTSYTQMSQYVHLLSSMPISMPTDLWVPVTQKIKPMQSHQFSLGGYYTGIKGWEFSAEGYYKAMRNVLEYKDGVSFFGTSAGWENKVEMGKGRSMGIELMTQKTVGKTTGWLSYTLSKSDRKFAKGGINNGERFPYKYDRRHSINLTVNHQFNDRIDIGVSWAFYTGGTSTIPEEKTAIIRPNDGINNGSGGGWIIPYEPSFTNTSPTIGETNYVEHRNNFRLPASHRLNIGINFNKKTKHGIRTWNISLYNVYNAMNPAWIYRAHNEQGKGVIKKYTLLPIIPSFTYTYKF